MAWAQGSSVDRRELAQINAGLVEVEPGVGLAVERELQLGPQRLAALGVVQDRDLDAVVVPGTGLGLAIVHDIMALHRGSVHYEDAPEGGARFIVRVPLASRQKVRVVVGQPPVSANADAEAKKNLHNAPVDL